MPRVGRYNKSVTLWKSTTTTNDPDGFFELLTPSTWWCAIQPMAPSPEGRGVSSLVSMRYHPQVTMDTRIVYQATGAVAREFFVRGFQNIDEQNAEMRLLCEEVIP